MGAAGGAVDGVERGEEGRGGRSAGAVGVGGDPDLPDAAGGVAGAKIERVHEFLVKALREAKQNSSWIAPREEYERAVQEFVARIVADEERLLPDFLDCTGRWRGTGRATGWGSWS